MDESDIVSKSPVSLCPLLTAGAQRDEEVKPVSAKRSCPWTGAQASRLLRGCTNIAHIAITDTRYGLYGFSTFP